MAAMSMDVTFLPRSSRIITLSWHHQQSQASKSPLHTYTTSARLTWECTTEAEAVHGGQQGTSRLASPLLSGIWGHGLTWLLRHFRTRSPSALTATSGWAARVGLDLMFMPSYLAYLWILAAHSSATVAVPRLSPLPMVMTYT